MEDGGEAVGGSAETSGKKREGKINLIIRRLQKQVPYFYFFIFSSFVFANENNVHFFGGSDIPFRQLHPAEIEGVHPNCKIFVNPGDSQQVSAVEFLDDKGKEKLKLQNKVIDSKVNGLRHEHEGKLKKIGNYFLFTEIEKQTPPQGDNYVMSNKVFAYDAEGALIFEKDNVEDELDSISENGKMVAGTAKSAVDVYSTSDGKLIYQAIFESPYTALSPSGKWLAFMTVGKFDVEVVNLISGSVYEVKAAPRRSKTDLNVKGFRDVTDEGSLIGYKRNSTRWKDGTGFDVTLEKVILYQVPK